MRKSDSSANEKDKQPTENDLRDLGVLYLLSEFLIVETETIKKVFDDETKIKKAKDVCGNCRRLLLLTDIFDKKNLERNSMVHANENSYILDSKRDADLNFLVIRNSLDVEKLVIIGFGQVSSTRTSKRGATVEGTVVGPRGGFMGLMSFANIACKVR